LRPGGFSFSGEPVNCIFLVDGFNLYHSLKDAQQESGGQTKWMNLQDLCGGLLQAVSSAVHCKVSLSRVEYFSAPPTFRSAGTQQRYQLYIQALQSTGVNVVLGRFKPKDIVCPLCRQSYVAHEEKETDVSIAIRLVELCMNSACDIIALMSGDTDLAPAIRMSQRLFPSVRIVCTFPYRRANKELSKLCPGSIAIKRRLCLQNQFNNPLVLPDGSNLHKPSNW
jgi:hypothetical protein